MKVKRFLAALVALAGVLVGVCGEGVGQTPVLNGAYVPSESWDGIDSVLEPMRGSSGFYQDLTGNAQFYIPEVVVNPRLPNEIAIYDESVLLGKGIDGAVLERRAAALEDFAKAAADGWNYGPRASQQWGFGGNRRTAWRSSSGLSRSGIPAIRSGTGVTLWEGLGGTPYLCDNNAKQVLEILLPVLQRAGPSNNVMWNVVPTRSGTKLQINQRFPVLSFDNPGVSFLEIADSHHLVRSAPVSDKDRIKIAERLSTKRPTRNYGLAATNSSEVLDIAFVKVPDLAEPKWGPKKSPPDVEGVVRGHRGVSGVLGVAGDSFSIVIARDGAAAANGCPDAQARLDAVASVTGNVDYWLHESMKHTPGVRWFSWGRQGVQGTWGAYYRKFGEKAPSQQIWENILEAVGGVCGDEAGRRHFELEVIPGPMGA
jgi:hypothetical protein